MKVTKKCNIDAHVPLQASGLNNVTIQSVSQSLNYLTEGWSSNIAQHPSCLTVANITTMRPSATSCP